MSYTVVGILPVGGNLTLREQYPLVQSRCHYNIVDVYSVAEVIQDYYSDAPINRDVNYVFPLPPCAAVCSFKAVIDDGKTIEGVVKEKGEAKRDYDQAVAQGKTAGLLQQEHADVFRVSLGNIEPRMKISVYISFISIIPHDGSSATALCITMPTSIAPRYETAPTNVPWTHAGNRFELTVSVQMNKPVTSVSSPSHPIGLTLGCNQKEFKGEYEPSKAFVHLADAAFLEKDIVIVVSAQGLDAPRCTAERWLESDGAEETTDAYALTLVPKFDFPALPRQEYIFLVDRSGSMRGERMNSVKAALQILLRSLPSRNTTFNILSFGTRHDSLWPASQPYTAEAMEAASKHVDTHQANYGGTELLSAMEYAFETRADIQNQGIAESEDKVPTSVFVLTDGQTWAVEKLVNSVTTHCEAAKASGSLLRTFVLGVGNRVSRAMCEGIARAGRGTAVFVATGEKPDAKLMGLLKAARGGVIDDLVVDWEPEAKVYDSMDDEFEIVDTPEPATSVVPMPQTPLSLFDKSHVDTPVEVGAQKAIVNLAPPPRVQQAPRSDKLPISLYPGFRCSIFAIIKQPSNPGPHSPCIKITGRVLGRDVVFQVPVTPVCIDNGIIEGAVEGGRLLHTLAAKALIQKFEDLPTTPETKAEIERLGKRYTLASSVTSFVAIDAGDQDVVPHIPQELDNRTLIEREIMKLRRNQERRIDRRSNSSVTKAGYMPPALPALSVSRSIIPLKSAPPPSVFIEPSDLGGGEAPEIPIRRVYTDAFGASDEDEDVAELMSSRPRGNHSDHKRKSSSFGPGGASVAHLQQSTPTYHLDASAASIGSHTPLALMTTSGMDSDEYVLGLVPLDLPLSVENVARAQSFDGSFPSSEAHFKFILGSSPNLGAALSLPPSLAPASGSDALKTVVWATIITVICLEIKLKDEQDAWEMLAEKANEFVQSALEGELGLSAEQAKQMVTDLKTKVAALI